MAAKRNRKRLEARKPMSGTWCLGHMKWDACPPGLIRCVVDPACGHCHYCLMWEKGKR